MDPWWRLSKFAMCGFCMLVLIGCLLDRPELSDLDPNLAGLDGYGHRRVVDEQGTPIGGATILLFDLSCTSCYPFEMRSRRDGYYPRIPIDSGVFRVVVRDGANKLGEWIDSVEVRDSVLPTAIDTLRPMGTLRGSVRLEAGGVPSECGLRLIPGWIEANCTNDGLFVLRGIPAGVHEVLAWVSTPDHGQAQQTVSLSPGQDLFLDDPLRVPYFGIRRDSVKIWQDTLLGNVHLSWNRANCQGSWCQYMIERSEIGSFTDRITVDSVTSWTDSLDGFWKRQPIFGPWTSTSIEYKVSLSGMWQDTPVVMRSIVAQPPAWTRHLDSLDPRMVVDSNSIATFSWNSPEHPDLAGWEIHRYQADGGWCQGVSKSNNWSDSLCWDPGSVLDRTLHNGTVIELQRFDSTMATYYATPTRKSALISFGGPFAIGSRMLRSRWVRWRDSTLSGLSGHVGLKSFGGWILWVDSGSGLKLSRDGVAWEAVPDSLSHSGWDATGHGDSVWFVRLDVVNHRLTVASRSGNPRWRSRSYDVDPSWSSLSGLAARGDGWIAAVTGNDPDGSTTLVEETSNGISARGDLVDLEAGIGGDPILRTLDDGSWIQGRVDSSWLSFAIHKRDGSIDRFNLEWWHGRNRYLGPLGDGNAFLLDYWGGEIHRPVPAIYVPSLSRAILLDLPSGLETWVPIATVVFRDELWVVQDGKLWKGALRLP